MQRYKQQNNVHELPDEDINENNQLFAAGCRALGHTVKKFPVNIKGCKGSGMCNMGCPNQAKQGTNRVQLPAAEAQGVQVITNCRVHRITPHAVEAEVVSWPHGRPSSRPIGRCRFGARIVVVAAGAMHSSALLAHSRLPVDLPALGRYFTCHPALTLVAQHDRPIINYYGFPKTYYCDDFEEQDEFILETCMYFPFTTAKSLAGFGAPHSALMADFRRLQMILVLVSDEAEAENRITADSDGNPVLHYKLSERTLDALVASQRIATKIFFAGGAARVHAPAADRFLIEQDRRRPDDFGHRRPRQGARVGLALCRRRQPVPRLLRGESLRDHHGARRSGRRIASRSLAERRASALTQPFHRALIRPRSMWRNARSAGQHKCAQKMGFAT
jgi:choline dehydrogenase-like flavoprotein